MSFDLLAPHYRWIEFVSAGDELQRHRTTFLGQIPGPRHALIAGEGNGRFLAEFRRQFPAAKITCVDASARMLALAKKRLARNGSDTSQIEFVRADVLNWQPPATEFDLVVTHFFLDCFHPEQIQMLVQKLSAAAGRDAHWLLADFQIPPAGLRRQRARLILWLLYRFFRATTRLPAGELADPGSFLKTAGFQLHRRHIGNWGLLRSDWWQRRAGKAPGASAPNNDAHSGAGKLSKESPAKI